MARRTITRILVPLLVFGALLPVAAEPAAAASSGLSCRYTVISWTGGFSAELAITNNTATTVNGWTAFWTFPDATQVTATWNGSIVQGSPYDATARSTVYNGVIRPGAASALGWTATASATDVPAEILVNGRPCPLA